MKLEIDETDFQFVTQILCRAKATHESLMTDPNHCQVVRDRHRENAKMAQTAFDLMYEAMKKGEDDVADANAARQEPLVIDSCHLQR